jgi:hypothetical protein
MRQSGLGVLHETPFILAHLGRQVKETRPSHADLSIPRRKKINLAPPFFCRKPKKVRFLLTKSFGMANIKGL